MTTAQAIAALAPPCYDVDAALAALPYGALEDDYKRDPRAACRKALRLTRAISKPFRRLRAIDRLLANHGVERIALRNGETGFHYSNTGDSYATTVLLYPSGAFRVSSWGDIMERSTRYA